MAKYFAHRITPLGPTRNGELLGISGLLLVSQGLCCMKLSQRKTVYKKWKSVWFTTYYVWESLYIPYKQQQTKLLTLNTIKLASTGRSSRKDLLRLWVWVSSSRANFPSAFPFHKWDQKWIGASLRSFYGLLSLWVVEEMDRCTGATQPLLDCVCGLLRWGL